MELNLKSAQNYIDLGRFYTDTLGIHQVLWLVKTEAEALFIQKNLMKGSSNKAIEHSFITISQWLHQLWQTEITLGKNHKQNIENIFGTIPVLPRSPVPDKVLFEFRKKLMNSTVHTNQIKSVSAVNKIIGY